jgi:diguanylate cyclase (GGDEF)-like protein
MCWSGSFEGEPQMELFEHERVSPRPYHLSALLRPTRQTDRDPGSAGRAIMLLGGIWLLGLIALAAVIQFDRRVDDARRAQLVIEQIRDEQGTVLAVAFDPAVAAASSAADRKENALQLRLAKSKLGASVATLAGIGHSAAPTRIAALDHEYLKLIDRLSALVGRNASGPAALELGRSQRPGGISTRLTSELEQADTQYASIANHSRTVASVGTTLAIVLLLIAFSIAFQVSLRARRRSHLEATTDALTGLGNRRKLFDDMKRAVASLDSDHTVAIGIFDLDGFKAYNDTFGHPAGDALLARLGVRLAEAVGDDGRAYRIGGDEFVVVTAAANGDSLLAEARAALWERGAGFSIGCSLGATRIFAGITLEEALHVADQRLYANKRSAQSKLQSDVKDALLQVLIEQDRDLVTHLAHVAALAESTAITLGLPLEQVRRAKLAAELHDIGKSAIPASILDKPGPLDADERSFMERHSMIGERIVAAAATLEAIAPIVRSAHERCDGAGYPDGLTRDEIPICSRIIAVVDAFDAMTNDRPYRHAASSAAALAELHRHSGTQFDPAVVDAFAIALAARDAALEIAA